jgi:hypothetical protein
VNGVVYVRMREVVVVHEFLDRQEHQQGFQVGVTVLVDLKPRE